MIDISTQAKIYLMPPDTHSPKCLDEYIGDCRKHKLNSRLGDVFVFIDVEAIQVGLLSYDGNGYQWCIKRLSSGQFAWPVRDKVMEIDIATLRLFYQGESIEGAIDA
ncbi:MAG: IS66 family insertion sequence element accessory protein TnpB [Psychrosphaera sp.]|nr:IS66 family insertion sequence element accessory protein TnpB [Psychrosphaera sp.]